MSAFSNADVFCLLRIFRSTLIEGIWMFSKIIFKTCKAMKIEGSCHCGAILYEAELDPESVGICHCTDCQKLSASAFRTFGVVQAGDFRLLKGNPKIYIKTGDSGNRREQAFCKNCGSGLYSASPGGDPKAHNIRMGTLVQRDQLPPQFQLWCRSAQTWLPEIETPKKLDKR